LTVVIVITVSAALCYQPVRAGGGVVQDSRNVLPGSLRWLRRRWRDRCSDGRCTKQLSVATIKQFAPFVIGHHTQTTILPGHIDK